MDKQSTKRKNSSIIRTQDQQHNKNAINTSNGNGNEDTFEIDGDIGTFCRALTSKSVLTL